MREIQKGDHVVVIMFPHNDRTGEVTVVGTDPSGEKSYNVWMDDNNDTLGFWEGEIELISE